MPVSYEGVRRRAPRRAHRLRRLRRLPHGRDRDLRPAGARAAAAAALQRRREARGRRRPVLGALPARRRRARRPLHLPARRRPLPHRHQRREPRAATWPGFASTPRASTPRSTDRLDDYAMLAVQGPDARAIVAPLVDGELPPRMHTAELARRWRGRARLRHRLHGRGRGGGPARARRRRRRSGTRCSRPARRPPGLGARDTLRLEVCFHLYGNDLSTDRNPIEAGLGWCCKEETGFIGSEAVAAARADGTAERLAPVRAHRPRHPAPGQPGARRRRAGRRGDQRHALAVPRSRDRDGLRPRRPGRARDRDRDRRPGQAPPRAHRVQAPLRPRPAKES